MMEKRMYDREINIRVIFLDNIRSLMIFCVIIVHAASAYAPFMEWWHVRDSVSPGFGLLLFVLDIFQMPVLFFIAGYFAVPSLDRRGPGIFVVAKLKRLGIPLALIGIFLNPLMPYIRYRSTTSVPMGFFDYWVRQMKTVVSLRFEHAADMTEATKHLNDFIQHHLWFISLLLIFFIIFAFGAVIKNRLQPAAARPGTRKETANTRTILLSMFTAGLAMAVVFALVSLVSKDGAWLKMGGFLLFQPTRVALYAGMFLLGIRAYSQSWFMGVPMPGRWWLWLTVVLGVLIFFVIGSVTYAKTSSPLLSFANGLCRALICLCCVGLFTTLGYRHWNRPTRVNRSLAASSYDIYLIHLPVVIVLQLLFLSLGVPIFIKFTLVALSATVLSWGASSFLVLPYPKASVMALLAVFGLVAALVR
jgi:peptidoglycan/LPS O-acetylase OafA/YrhL